ncbi:uncharacterized protein LOC134213820 [Armigeres subalbatus]|uniref:uncharacterized protein LOC134213820 n=1 Tax=Armigeres subalbatus TaxID=124917 RepID=UPI002ED02D0C
MSIPLDAREILSHLNQLGYRNITPDQLKEFQKDLRKLIKFDTGVRGPNVGASLNPEALMRGAQQMNTFQRLHTLTTISYDAKIARNIPTKQSQSATVESRKESETGAAQHLRSETVTPVDEHDAKEIHLLDGGRSKKLKSGKENVAANKMWIRPRSSSANSFRKNDPVSLYHSYQKDWARFKNQLPGENDRSDLRWQIRTKLLGEK